MADTGASRIGILIGSGEDYDGLLGPGDIHWTNLGRLRLVHRWTNPRVMRILRFYLRAWALGAETQRVSVDLSGAQLVGVNATGQRQRDRVQREFLNRAIRWERLPALGGRRGPLTRP